MGDSKPSVARELLYARLATLVGFGSLGGLAYTWSTGVTAFRQQLGLAGSQGDFQFGLIALTAGIAATVGALFIGLLSDRRGPRFAFALCALMYPLAQIGLAFVHGPALAVAVCVILGLFHGAMDTAVNAHGIEVERYYGRSIMSSFHACYSLGGFVIGLLGSWFAGRDATSARLPFSVLGGSLLVTGLLAVVWMIPKDRILPEEVAPQAAGTNGSHQVNGGGNVAVVLLMLGFGVLLLGSMANENALGDWGQEYLHRIVRTPVALAGLAVAVFTGAEALGRVFGDRLAQHFGRAMVVFVSSLLSLAGLILTVVVNQTWAALVGFALLGLGLASIAPLMLASAARADLKNAGRNIGIVNAVGYSANLVSPAAITFVVTQFGLQRLLLFPIGLLLPLAILGPVLMRWSERRAQHENAVGGSAGLPRPGRNTSTVGVT